MTHHLFFLLLLGVLLFSLARMCFLGWSLCWLLVASVGKNWPGRTPHAVSCSEPVPQRKSTIESRHLLIFTKGEWTLCSGFSRSSRA
jgi:hypothetical protein